MEKQTTILFTGDSITDCGRGREEGQDHVLGQGYPNLIASKLGNLYAEQRPVFLNRGISGNRVSDLYARWNEDAISLKPDLISILIGINDIWRIMRGLPSGATDRFERLYRHLLEETREVLPDASLVLCEPFALPASATEEGWESWQSRLRDYSQTLQGLASQYGAVFVPLQAAFDRAAERTDAAYWLGDGVHPTPAGHDLIAEEWLIAVNKSDLDVFFKR